MNSPTNLNALEKTHAGALLIRKSAGPTSFGVVDSVRKIYRGLGVEKRAVPGVGHGGTLDPFATGLLIVLLGQATKLSRYFLGSSKVYTGVIRFGEKTATADPEGARVETTDVLPVSLAAIREAARSFEKEPYLQVPPMFSAKKVDGKALYELARAGKTIERKPVACKISEFEILEYESPRARFRVRVSSGTYIRVLAEDLAQRLGSLALLETLERTQAGGFVLEQAQTLEEIQRETAISGASPEVLTSLRSFIPMDRLLSSYFAIDLSDAEAMDLKQGRQHGLARILSPSRIVSGDSEVHESATEQFVGLYCAKKLVAVASRAPGTPWRLDRVFC